jgi:hypothetical protein
MIDQARRRLTYANVMSTVGVFLALGGGFALAKIKGDGRIIQKGSKVEGPLETIANVPGVVKVRAECIGALQITIENTSDKTLELHRGVGGDTAVAALTPGDQEQYSSSGNEIVQVFRAGTKATPMAQLTISGQYPGTCAAQPPVAVTAISSE